jgi:hypothetical protein
MFMVWVVGLSACLKLKVRKTYFVYCFPIFHNSVRIVSSFFDTKKVNSFCLCALRTNF